MKFIAIDYHYQLGKNLAVFTIIFSCIFLAVGYVYRFQSEHICRWKLSVAYLYLWEVFPSGGQISDSSVSSGASCCL